MSAMEPLYSLMGISTCKLSKKELLLLEAKLFTCICEEFKEMFRNQHRDYFHLMKFTIEQENIMLEINFIRLIIKDILSTEEYTLAGIAYYTDTHEDIVQEVFSGRNTNPSAKLLRRIIELHYSIRRDLYKAMMKKIAIHYLAIV